MRLLTARTLSLGATCAGVAFVSCSFLDIRSYEALDYRVDRPRVLAVRAEIPEDPYGGGPVHIDALMMRPGGEAPDGISVQICDEGLEQPVAHLPFVCFSEPQMVRVLGDTLPLTWVLPDFAHFGCDPSLIDTGTFAWIPGACQTAIPVLVGMAAGDDWAYGGTDLSPVFIELPPRVWGTPATGDTGGDPAEEAWAALDLDAIPGTFEVEGPVRAGQEVEIRFLSVVPPFEYAWYVDAGELAKTGRTAIQEEREDGWLTVNQLRIPANYVGPLRVAVVMGSQHPRLRGAIWATTTLEVMP